MSIINTAIRKKDGKDKPTRFYSNKQEKHVAKELNGKQQPNSGATTFKKGDVCADDWLIECKTCTKLKDSFSIKKEWLEKNLRESVLVGKEYNALAFNFGPNEKMYYIIDEKTFEELFSHE